MPAEIEVEVVQQELLGREPSSPCTLDEELAEAEEGSFEVEKEHEGVEI